MGKVYAKRVIITLLGLFVVINLFFWITPKLNPDRMPGIGKWRVLSVLTGSMAPTIEAGDMVIVSGYGQSVPAVGDIVTYWQDQSKTSLITHRVVQRLDNGFLQTRGDANQEVDGGWTPPANLVGKVVITIPFASTIQNAMQHPYGYAMMTIIFILLLYRDRRLIQSSPIKEEVV